MDGLFNNVSASTKKARIRYLYKIGVKDIHDYPKLYDVTDIVSKYVFDSENVNTQNTRIFHIIEYLKSINKPVLLIKYEQIMRIIKSNSIKKQNDTKHTDKSRERYIELKELQSKLIKLNPLPIFNMSHIKRDTINKFHLTKLYQDYLLLCFYILNPPLRNDLAELKLVRKKADIVDKKTNYIVISTRRIYIYLNEFKNSKSMGPTEINISAYVVQIIRNLIKLFKYTYPDESIDTLFHKVGEKKKFEARTEDNLRKRIQTISKKYFEIPLSINDYRHIWEIDIQSAADYNNMTLNEREDLHKQLLHNLNTALRYNRV
jgi:hypothetical protein